MEVRAYNLERNYWENYHRKPDFWYDCYETAVYYACQGDAYAKYVVGYLHLHGSYTSFTPIEAVEPAGLLWLKMAAEEGVAAAHYELYCHERKWFYIGKDYLEDSMKEHLRKGAELGHEKCQYWMEHDPVDYFHECEQKLAQNPYDDYAFLRLAECYTEGIGVKRDEKKAFELVETAYKQGHNDGPRERLISYYQRGIGTPRNMDAAMALQNEQDDEWERLDDCLSR